MYIQYCNVAAYIYVHKPSLCTQICLEFCRNFTTIQYYLYSSQPLSCTLQPYLSVTVFDGLLERLLNTSLH